MTNRVISLEYDVARMTLFEKSIRPFEIIMSIFGSGPTRSKSGIIRLMHGIYAACTIVLTIYLLIVGFAYFVVHPKFDKFAPNLVIMQMWHFLTLTCFIIFFVIYRKNCYLPRFFQQLDEYFNNVSRKDDEIRTHLNKLRRKMWIFVVTLNVIYLTPYGYLIVKFRNLASIAESSGEIFPFPFTIQQFFAYFFQSLLHFMTSLLFFQSLTFGLAIFIMVADTLTNEFKVFNEDLCQALKNPDQLESGLLEELRWRHEQLRGLVDQADRTFGKYIAANYITLIPFSCFVFYQLLYTSVFSELVISVGNFGVVMIIEVILITYFSLRLTDTAEEHVTAMYAARVDRLDHKVVLQLIFLSESMKGHFIGFSISNILNVSKDTILTFLGALITYIIVVADFQR